MSSNQNPIYIQNFYPRDYNKSTNIIINNNSNGKSINRLMDFIYNKNVNIYEDENYEFKQFVINSEKDITNHLRQNMKYFSAFLNSNSGILYFGINDNGDIKGIELTSELKYSFELKLDKIIETYDEHIKKNQNITYFFHEVKNNGEMIINKDKTRYVIEINIKVGLPDHIYTTPYKEDDNDDYGCYIKLNGTVKKIAGESLFYYTKNKIMKYVKSLAEKNNNLSN